MRTKSFALEIKISGERAVAAGHPPFLVHPVAAMGWMVTGRDGGNCVAYAADGLRAVFSAQHLAVGLCEVLNERAAA